MISMDHKEISDKGMCFAKELFFLAWVGSLLAIAGV